jgi:hypothetical protein
MFGPPISLRRLGSPLSRPCCSSSSSSLVHLLTTVGALFRGAELERKCPSSPRRVGVADAVLWARRGEAACRVNFPFPNRSSISKKRNKLARPSLSVWRSHARGSGRGWEKLRGGWCAHARDGARPRRPVRRARSPGRRRRGQGGDDVAREGR